MAHSNSTSSLSAGIKALADDTSTLAHTQGLWRFLNNADVTPDSLSTPLIAACHAALEECEGDYALSIHDWSRIRYNVAEQVADAQLALWYYFRWEIRSFFKLLKSAGHQLESWEQETARATFNRILIATQASVMAWSLMWNTSEDAARARSFLVRLSGRQMKRSRPVTFPALLDGLFKLLTMLETLEHYSISELKEFALIAKQQLNLT